MAEWLDDLSEDWVSQPPSSSPPSLSRSKNESARNPSTSLRDSELRRSVLSECSGSRDNIRLPSMPENQSGKSPRRGLARRSLSDESAKSALGGSVVVHKQVERKSVSVSPPKSRNSQDTPEWKRRLLKGEMGYGEQKDLFSARGIESIFTKPPPRSGSFRERSRGLSFLKTLESLPSSPPAWPSEPEASYGAPTKSAKGTMRGLEAVHEEDEESLEHHASLRSAMGTNDGANEGIHNMSFLDKDQVGIERATDQSVFRKPMAERSRTQSKSFTSSRVVSGYSEQSSDDFSPVFISKHNTADGRIDYAPLDISRSELEKQLKQLKDSQQSQGRKVSAQSQRSSENEDPSLARLQSEILPEDLPAGTPEVVSIGDFVNVRRGGMTPDGSFLRRPLSPSPLRNVSGSTAISTKAAATEDPLQAVGSRTQTTQRLSSLPEDTVVRHASGASQANTDSASQKSQDTQETAIRITGQKHAAITEVIQRYTTREANDSIHTPPQGSQIRFEFGQGHYDDYSFPEDLSSCSLGQEDSGESLASRSPPSSVLPPGSQQPFKFRVESPFADGDTFRGKRKESKTSAKSTLSVYKRSIQRGDTNVVHQKISTQGQNQPVTLNADGKRPPTSPAKNPTPKRRRTLFTSEMLENIVHEAEASIQEAHAKVQSSIGKKRKDARYDNRFNVAGPDVLAQRHILRPRNPTPSQRRRQEIEAELMDAAEEFVSSSPRLEAIKEHLSVADGSEETSEAEKARLVATEVAAFSQNVAHGMIDHGRKRSVTTQDFLDEATKIMNFIRTKGKPNSGLTSLVESELETKAFTEDADKPEDDQSLLPTSPLSISRPPTREGVRSGWRTREQQLDARVVSHLKKYQDVDDDGFMASSLRSSRFGAEVDRVASNVNRIESDPPGIHILEQKSYHHKRRGSDTTNEAHPSHRTDTSDRPNTQSSHTTAESSLGRTTASRKSDNVATLAPDVVAHLIPQEIAGMTFDQEKGIWVKAKSPRKEKKTIEEASNLSQSEEDPFNGIPDLTVDEMRESENLKQQPSTSLPPCIEEDVASDQGESDSSTAKANQSAEGINASDGHDSLLPPKHADLGRHKTKASEPKISAAAKEGKCSPKRQTVNIQEEVEHEYSILEGRSKPKHHRVSELKVSISSPFIQVRTTNSGKTEHSQKEHTGFMHYHENHGDGKPYDRTVSVVLKGAVDTPTTQSQNAVLAPSSPGPNDLTFYMSELPEFTLNQIDEREIPNRLIVKKTRGGFVQEREDRFAWGNHLLAKALQDVEPDTDWEDLHDVSLRGKGITSLHILDVVCDRLEKLDISCNELCQLSGAPPMIRSLNANQNLLTRLTSWGHLVNLQYLDVSNNNIDSLRGFGCLIHLRELKADHNQIASLEGLEELDALLKLSLRDNKIHSVDLAGYEL